MVQTFERETKEVIQVTIGEETYTTTSEHPFYVKGEGYIHAIELERGDEVLLLGEAFASMEETVETVETSEPLASDNNQSKDQETETRDADQTEEQNQQEQSHTTKYVEQIQVIKLEEPVLVYNFEVAENHNYFIGEQQVLVHNACGKNLDGGDTDGLIKTYRGGKHGDIKNPMGDGLDSHHIPAKQASLLDPNDGPAIQMEPADHRRTASYGGRSGSPQQTYRNTQKELISQGKFDDAFLMDIEDIQSKFGNKYNNAILEAIDALPKFK